MTLRAFATSLPKTVVAARRRDTARAEPVEAPLGYA